MTSDTEGGAAHLTATEVLQRNSDELANQAAPKLNLSARQRAILILASQEAAVIGEGLGVGMGAALLPFVMECHINNEAIRRAEEEKRYYEERMRQEQLATRANVAMPHINQAGFGKPLGANRF